jgi:CRP/FNR family transcriptional regulator
MNAPLSARAHVRSAPPRATELRDDIGIDLLREHVPVIRRRIDAGQYLYRAGQPFNALHLVAFGCLKTCELSEDGREQVTGFHMRGDLLGVESIGLARYACDVVALEDSEVWELPYPPMLTACVQVPALQARLTEALAAEIRRDRQWMLTLGTLGAESRVAAFLLDLAERHARIGLDANRFVLRMCRIDMASYLALKHETVSRVLSSLADAKLVEVHRRDVSILDAARLRQLVSDAPATAH